jgi:phosphate transport system protein
MNPHPAEPDSESTGILDRAIHAFTLAQCAVGETAVLFTTESESALKTVERCERDLDVIEREIDGSIALAIAGASAAESRELLTCLKFIIDIERIGDLLASVANCSSALGPRLSMDDLGDLVRMCCILERMLGEAQRAYHNRSVDQALETLRLDAQIDRLRNLILTRHLEQAAHAIPRDTVQVLFMAQSLERAGDHVKNIAEEICHVITGHSIRHLTGSGTRAVQQICLDWPNSEMLCDSAPANS